MERCDGFLVYRKPVYRVFQYLETEREKPFTTPGRIVLRYLRNSCSNALLKFRKMILQAVYSGYAVNRGMH
ncbi:hypothetical protein K1T71_013037 [Dendrolimus kikuchii]|uniref:Uncharacterized protein n=1 Tax=Dendrolimus kikuchii TaxID=765133 RepID=A0ACC1CJ49_9NEOP|nr:hypothetical protein K1T71_013037 [Dendrolimus kikuchii]